MVGDSRTVAIHADQYWNDTGITLVKDGVYDLKVVPPESRWVDGEGLLKYSADANGRNYWPLWLFTFLKRCRNADWFALIGARNKVEGEFFFIGKSLTNFKPDQNFDLYCFANDAKNKYDNNSGTLMLQIARKA